MPGKSPRITLHTLAVLGVLAEAPLNEHYGLEICRAAGLPGGTIYPILARLEKAGWLTSAWEEIDPVAEGRRPRRYYRLTRSGAERAQEARQQAARSLWPQGQPTPGGAMP